MSLPEHTETYMVGNIILPVFSLHARKRRGDESTFLDPSSSRASFLAYHNIQIYIYIYIYIKS